MVKYVFYKLYSRSFNIKSPTIVAIMKFVSIFFVTISGELIYCISLVHVVTLGVILRERTSFQVLITIEEV